MQKLNIFLYICTMKTTEALIKRIEKIGEGTVFTYSDLKLPPDMQAAAAMALSRMVAENKLRKAGKGKFYKPIYSRLGETTPMMEEMTKDLLYKDGKLTGYVTGVPIFAQMGLTTQISSKILIGSRFYRRPLVRGGYEIAFTRQENPITEDNISLLRFLDAIRFIKKIPSCTPDNAVKILLNKLSLFPNEVINSIIQLASSYSPSTRALLGAMLESIGYDVSILKSSINPLSRYNIGISLNTLSNKSDWHIL